MKHCMVDLETLGTKPGSALLSLGAVMFDESGVGARFYAVLGTGPQFTHGATVSDSTAAWWERQSAEAREVLTAAGAAQDTEAQLRRFFAWWREQGAKYIWGRGANFDPPLLGATLELFGLEAPWKFYDVRCERTLTALFPQIKAPPFSGTRHCADADAAHQALHASMILRHIRDMQSPLNRALDRGEEQLVNPSAADPLGMGLTTDAAIDTDLGAAIARIRKEKQ